VADDHHAEAPPSPGRHNQQPSDGRTPPPYDATVRPLRRDLWVPETAHTHTAGTTRLNLGSLLAERFERSGQRADLDEAVTVLRAAEAMVEVTERSSLFLNLANALARRHARFAGPADLDTAVDSARLPVAQLEPGSVRLLRYRITPAHLQTMRAPVLPRWRPVRTADGRGCRGVHHAS
jgi:hypothetical protein